MNTRIYTSGGQLRLQVSDTSHVGTCRRAVQRMAELGQFDPIATGRVAIVATELEKSIVQSQRELRTQLESMNRNLIARFAEFEERMAKRPVERVVATRPEVVVADVPAGSR